MIAIGVARGISRIAGAAICLLFLISPAIAEPNWQMNRVLLGSPLLDVAFPDDNSVLAATANGLVMMDNGGAITWRQDIDSTASYPILAENGVYGIVRHRARVPQFTEGIEICRTGDSFASFPISGSPYLSPRGDWLVTVDRYANRVTIYNAPGKKLREDTYPEIRNYGLKFSADGNHVALNLPQNGENGIAVVYDNVGRLQTKVIHVLGEAQPALMPGGDTLMLIARAVVTVYNETGVERQRIRRGNRAGLGMMTRDGRELWLAEGGGLRVLTIANGDSRIVVLPDAGAVVKLTDEPSGQRVLVGQRSERRESGVVWTWQALERSGWKAVWRGEDRARDGYAVLGPGVIVKGTEEIEIWIAVNEGR